MLENIENVFPLKIGVAFSDSNFARLPDRISGLLPDRISGLFPESSAVLFLESRLPSLPDNRSNGDIECPSEQSAEGLELSPSSWAFSAAPAWQRRSLNRRRTVPSPCAGLAGREGLAWTNWLGGRQPIDRREGHCHGKENRHKRDLERVSHLGLLGFEGFAPLRKRAFAERF